jgi:hypothetical protein
MKAMPETPTVDEPTTHDDGAIWPEGWLDDDDALPDTVREVPQWLREAPADGGPGAPILKP